MFQLKVAQHSLSGLFGTFLFNSVAERMRFGADKSTFSLWDMLSPKNSRFRNVLYDPLLDYATDSQELQILSHKWDVRHLSLWQEFYAGSHVVDGARERTRTGSFTLLPQMTSSGSVLNGGDVHEPSIEDIGSKSAIVDATCRSTIDSLMATANGNSGSSSEDSTIVPSPDREPGFTNGQTGGDIEQVSLVLANMLESVTLDSQQQHQTTGSDSPEPPSLTSNDLFSDSIITAALTGRVPNAECDTRVPSFDPTDLSDGTHMATSTTDISDSRVVKRYHHLVMSNGSVLVPGRTQFAALKNGAAATIMEDEGGGEDRAWDQVRSNGGPRLRHISEWLDVDGMIMPKDPVQDRMRSKTKQFNVSFGAYGFVKLSVFFKFLALASLVFFKAHVLIVIRKGKRDKFIHI